MTALRGPVPSLFSRLQVASRRTLYLEPSMMRHLSWRAIRSHAATGTAAVVYVIGIACADATSPVSTLALRTPSMDRRTPTFEYVTIDVPGAVATTLQGINAGGDIV